MKRSIKEMTFDELCQIASIATGGWSSSESSRGHREVEVGGYGWRRRVEWIQNSEGYDEYHYFEITGENKGRSWEWHCKSTYEIKIVNICINSGGGFDSIESCGPDWSKGHLINTLNPVKIVDYCREQELDIENTLR